MRKSVVVRFLALALLLAAMLLPLSQAAAAYSGYYAYANPAFYNSWYKVDGVVSNGVVRRPLYWGAGPVSDKLDNSPSDPGRIVQYFDKGRMEITDVNGDKSGPYYVSSSLLAKELVSGQREVQERLKIARSSALIPIVSDMDDAKAVTYASFKSLINSRAANISVGVTGKQSQPIATLDYQGKVGSDGGKFNAGNSALDNLYYDNTTGHNLPRAFWDFLNASGPTYDCTAARCVVGGPSGRKLDSPWYLYSGLPISEPYWIKAKIGNRPNMDVLVQVFERRVLYYMPDGAAGQKVQFANVGRAHYVWIYGMEGLG